MRNEMINLLEGLSKVDPAQTPNYRMMILLRDSFVNHGLKRSTAERLVSTMRISISEDAINDQELVEMVLESYGRLAYRMYLSIKADFLNDADDVLCNVASTMSIVMEF